MSGTLFDRRRRNPVAGVARRPRRMPVDDLLDLMADRDPAVRAGVLMVLGRQVRGDSRVMAVLLETARGDHPESVRLQAVEKLGDLGDPSVIPALKEMAPAESCGIRRAVAVAVATIQARDL